MARRKARAISATKGVGEKEGPFDTQSPARDPGLERTEDTLARSGEEIGDARRHALGLSRLHGVGGDKTEFSQAVEDPPRGDLARAQRQR
jgi:hypothetical protein